jgi:hypothetical protein
MAFAFSSPAKRAAVSPGHARKPRGAPGERAVVSRARSVTSPALVQGESRPKAPRIQPKLKVGEPNDRYEQEADRVAEQVMRMPEPQASERAAVSAPALPTRIQRVCRECEEELSSRPMAIQRMCSECEEELQRQPMEEEEEEEETIQTRAWSGRTPEVTPDLQAQINGLRGHGRPLSAPVRAFFEPRFGYDFGRVRVHTGFRAAHAARSIHAHAFTVGPDVVFGDGRYAPESETGRRVLAHELTHVVQQNTGMPSGRPAVRPRFPGQREAHPRSPASHGTPPGIQRLVRRSLVACPAGQNPFSADRRAARLLTNAIARIDRARAARAAHPANADVVAVSRAMRRAFRLNPANNNHWTRPAPHFGLLLIRRRLEIARNYINSVVFTFNCCNVGAGCAGSTCGTCNAGDEAFVCGSQPSTIQLCPLFWTRGLNQRGRVLAHEVLHINFGFIGDWAQPDRTNAHCYAQFTALLNGFNSPPGFRCH